MSESLADLFSTSSPPPPPQSPPTRSDPHHPLFLSPGDTPGRSRPSNHGLLSNLSPPPFLFDDEPFPTSINPSTAQANGLTNGQDYGSGGRDGQGSRSILRQPTIPPLEDPLAGFKFDNMDATTGDGGGGGDDERPVKKRRVMAKIDQERLMSEKGFPALMKVAKRFKSKGKGHEATDLHDLLGMYQLWAHGMFPKGDFAGTIARVETVCRTRRMEIAMKGYREAFYPPPPRSPSPPGLSPLHTTPPPSHTHTSKPPSPSPLTRRRSGQPHSSRLFDLPPEEYIDELMAMEEMECEQDSHSKNQSKTMVENDIPPVVEDEDEWEGLYD